MNIINVLIEMLASIIAHGLASKDHFNTFLTRGLYDPRLLVNYIYPFQGVFADASVDKFIEYASCIAEINHLDYQKTYQNLMSQNLSPALLHDNQELFVHIILTKNITLSYSHRFHLPYKRKCFEWCFKQFKWGNEIFKSEFAMDYAYLLNEKQIEELLFYKPEFLIHFSNLGLQKINEIIHTDPNVLYDEKVRIFYKNICETQISTRDPFVDKIIEYIELTHDELFKQEEIILSNFNFDSLNRNTKREELEQALSLCELRIITKRERLKITIRNTFKQFSWTFEKLKEYKDSRLLNHSFQLNNERRRQIVEEILCIPSYYIYVCWLHKRYDIIYNLYYELDLQLSTLRLPPLNEIQFRLALPPVNNDIKYDIYAKCFINNRTDLVASIIPLNKIDYHLLLTRIAQLDEKKFHDRDNQICLNDETKFIIRRFLQPSKIKTLSDKSNITFLIRASVLEDEKPDRILADIQIRLLELGAFDILDRFTVLADDLWIRAVNSLNYYAMKYLLGRGFRPIGNENITGGQCYDLIRVA